ncbi:MAG: cobalamin B12-binding domain-containing protein [Chloroflexi bacterium]|nr:cobalamin B12-binding domain-containing protein [Chloroflexota bacterium]
MSERKVRFLLVADSPGHTTGYYIIARALREAGVEVILGGYLQTEAIVEAAIQEDVDFIGYRIMDREPMMLIPPLMELLAERGLDQVRVVVGGIIPQRDITRFKELGVDAVFRPGARLDDIVAHVLGGRPPHAEAEGQAGPRPRIEPRIGF